MRNLFETLLCLCLAAALTPAPALACRCAQRNLGDYFAAADLVFLGRALSVRSDEKDRVVDFESRGTSYKGDPASIVRFTTPVSSASCGAEVESGLLYLVFATRDESDATTARFDTCSGTRSFDPKASAGVSSFQDVEARQVLPKLVELRRAAASSAPPSRGAQLPEPGDPHAELIGLVELPSILNLDEPGSSSPPPRLFQPPIAVYAAPEAGAAVIANLRGANDVLTREYTYERKAAVVRRRQPQWYEVALPENRSGWIRAESAGSFHAVADLIVNRLGYLTAAWDGWLWPEPGAGHPIERVEWRTAERKEAPVNVVATQDIGGSLWLQVEVLAASPCEGGSPRVVLSGWVPAYTAAGKLTAWFYSRGC